MRRPLSVLLLPVLLAPACHRAPDQAQQLAQLDNELAQTNAADPAIASALHDQIVVDPALTQQSNANAVKPPPRPDSAAIAPDTAGPDPVDAAGLRQAPRAGACPDCAAHRHALTLGALAARQRLAATAACAGPIAYSAGWANRLPVELPLYPDARVAEAAGNNLNGCRLRVVSFATAAAPAKLIDWYYTRATAAGYGAEHGREGGLETLGGTRGDDAYMVYASPRPGGGSDVDLVSNAGR